MLDALLINSDKKDPIRLLAEHSDVRLSVLTKPKYAYLYEGIGEVWPVDDLADLMQCRARAVEILRCHPIDTVIAPMERSLLTAGYLRSFLDLPGLKHDQVAGFANKLVMKHRLQDAELPVAPFRRIDRIADIPAAAERLGWPVVVKPAIGSGTFNTYKIDSPRHFERLYAAGELASLESAITPVVLERFVEMDHEYHCDGVVQDGQVTFASVARYTRPLLSSLARMYGSYILADDDPMTQSIRELHQQVVLCLGLDRGVTHFEAYETPHGLLVGEITCRPGGAGILPAIEHAYGISLWDVFVRLALGECVSVEPRRVPGVHGWCGVPGRNGRILAMSSEEELKRLPGVVASKPNHSVGEVVDERLTSVFFCTNVLFNVPGETDVESLFDRIQHSFVLQTE